MPPGPSSLRIRQFLSILLLLLAAWYWLCQFGIESLGTWQRAGVIAAAIAAFIPSIRREVNRFYDQCNLALRQRPRMVAILVGFIIAVYLFLFAYACRDRLYLKLNDEHAYMIQARMLAQGRLWVLAYPADVSPFFDALGMIVDRVYAPMYFPGTALAAVPFVWLGLPFWVMPLLTASLAAAFLYLIVAEIFDPVRALLAVTILASIEIYRDNAIVLLAEAPFLAAEAILLFAWLRFRRRANIRWALLIGVAAGYVAITRPLDGLCVVLPVAVAILFQLGSRPAALLRAGATALAAASPFLLLLLIQNLGVTGHPFELAETYYNRENFPASPMGFHDVDPNSIPTDMVPLKQDWLRSWVLPSFERHTPYNALRSWYDNRLKITLADALPNPILILLLPVALLSLRDPLRQVLIAPVPLFLIGYAIYLFFLDHYAVSILPSVICMVLLGWEILQDQWPRQKWIGAFLLVFILAIAITGLWPITPAPAFTPWNGQEQPPANRYLALLPKTPAVVLFRFDPSAFPSPVQAFSDDPVYNDTVAWPDDASVIRARDLGPDRNRAIIRYYAQHQPDRTFYVYDPDIRAAGGYPILGPFGTARDLAITGTVP